MQNNIAAPYFIDKTRKAIVQYFFEEYSKSFTSDDVKDAIAENLYEVTLYLLEQKPTLQLGSFSTEKLIKLLHIQQRHHGAKNRDMFSWLTGTEGRKQGFQFSLLNLTDCINKDLRDLVVIMMASPEFPSLFDQLSNEQKKKLIEQIVLLPRNLQELHQNKLVITQMINKINVGQMVKITAFAQALFFQDKAFAKQFFTSWQDLAGACIKFSSKTEVPFIPHASVEMFRFIHPRMLAWLEKQWNVPIPNEVLDRRLAFFDPEVAMAIHKTSLDLHLSVESKKSVQTYLTDWLKSCFVQALNHQRELMDNDAKAAAATRSVGLFASRDISAYEKFRQLKQDIQQLGQIKCQDADFDKTMEQVRVDMTSLESQISKSEAGSVNISQQDLERLQFNVNKVKPYLEKRARLLV